MARKRILLIDHRPEHMHQPVFRLQLEGYEVDQVSDGASGLERLRSGDIDLLLLDAELPGDPDGWETLRRIREDDELADTRVIVFMAAKGETSRIGLYHVEGELRRPFPIGEMLEKVRLALGER